MPKKILSIVFLVFVCGLSLSFAQEDSVTFTTYYPSPYGSYNQLQTNSLGVGDNNGDGILSSADVPPTPGPPNGDVWIKGKVGIGTTGPVAKLTIWDNTSDESQMIRLGYSATGDYKIYRERTTGTLIIQGTQDGYNNFSYKDDAGNVLLRILENGNVGIGTASPGAKLEVNSVLRLTPVSSAPTGVEGGLYYNTTENVVKYHDGSAWKNIGSAQLVCQTITGNPNLTCPSGYTCTGGGIILEAGGFVIRSSPNDNGWSCNASINFTCYARCCKIQ